VSDLSAFRLEWNVLLKVELPPGHPIAPAQRDVILSLLPGTDKTVDGGGPDFTLRLWASAADAAQATANALAALEAARIAIGVPAWRVIRAHSTSAELRVLDAHDGTTSRLDDPRAWSVAIKVVRVDGAPAGPEQMRRLGELLPREDTFLHGAADQIATKFWVDAANAGEAALVARRVLLDALAQVGLGRWRIVRMHPCSPADRATEVYVGANQRYERERAVEA
jgi:hypothetical protein